MENDSRKGKEPPLILGVALPDASGPRRSARESISKKNMTRSSSSLGARKSERLEKPAAVSPAAHRKSERLEKQNAPSPLRRSPRTSSESKKLDNSSGSLTVKKKQKKEKSVKQLTTETQEVNGSRVKKIKWSSARTYRKLFSPQSRKDNLAGHSKEQNQRDNIFVGCDSNPGVQAPAKIVDGVDECNARHAEEMSDVASETCPKRQRVSHDAQQKGFCSCSAKQDSCDGCIPKDGIVEQGEPLLDCQIDSNGNKGLVVDPNPKINKLKEKLTGDIANVSKLGSLRFVEYWVPVKISSMQLEQYCATLLSNSLSLCSSSRNDAVGVLREILISTRKCCDHPYVTDPSLQASLIKEGKAADILKVGINASSKLQLLDAMLSVIRNRGSKVLILFQSSGGSGNIGDILDDFVRQRYGEDSYERVDGIVVSAKKQAAVNNFNNNKRMFVFLLETRACSSIIKLSPVDIVIIFGSDWCPMNDVRNLQKIRLDSPSEQIKVFRLYSSYTVEEKALILGKRDKALDSKLQTTNPSTCHMLLMWGASCLFEKLAKFHSGNAVAPNTDQSFLKDIVREFLAAISEDSTDNSSGNLSLIGRVKQNQEDDVANFQLFGERKITLTDEEPPHVFWEKLLGGKRPEWKNLSVSSQRNRKRTQHYENLSKKPEIEDDGITKKQKKVPTNTISWPSLETDAGDTVGGDMESHAPTSSFLAEKDLLGVPDAETDKLDEGLNFWNSQRSLHLVLKPEIAKLCAILHLPEDVKATVESFLEYVMNNHRVTREPATTLEAFQISLCWIAASLLKHKLNHKESVALAKQHLNFGCRKQEADYIYSMLRCLKNTFLDRTANMKTACFPEAFQKLTKDSIQDHLHARPSKSVPCDLQYVGVETSQENDQVLSQLGLAQNDFLKSIKEIEKKCQKQMKKLLLMQKDEKEKLCKKYEEDEALLNHKHKTEAAVIRLCGNNSMKADRLKLLDTEHERKLEELKHQKEMVLKNLEATHVAERNKLQERRTEWFEGVISWAKVELINKKTSNGSEHSQVEAVSLSSFSKERILGEDQCRADGEAAPEIPEALSSNGDEEDVPPFTSERIFDGAQSSIAKSSLAGEKTLPGIPKMMSSRNASDYVVSVIAPSSEGRTLDTERLGVVPETVCSNDGLENLNDKPSSEEQSFDGASFPMPKPNEELTTGVPQTVSSNGVMENVVPINHLSGEETSDRATSCMHDDDIVLGSPKTALNRTLEEGNAVGFQQGRLAHDIAQDSLSTDDIAGVHQQRREAPSGVPETASGEAVDVSETGMQQDGKYTAAKTNQESRLSNKTNQHCHDVSLRMPESDPSGAEEAAVTSNEPDGKMEADNSMANQDFQSWDRTSTELMEGGGVDGEMDDVASDRSHSDRTSVDKQDGVLPSGEPETASTELMDGGGIDREMDDVANQNNYVASDRSHSDRTSVDKQDGVLPSGEPETASAELMEGGGIDREMDDVANQNNNASSDRSHSDITSVDKQHGVLPSGEPETASAELMEGGGIDREMDDVANQNNNVASDRSHGDRTSVDKQDGVLPSAVPETASAEIMEGGGIDTEMDDVANQNNNVASDRSHRDRTSVDKLDGVLSLGEPETASAELMEGGGIDRGMDDVANQNNNASSDRSHSDEQIMDVQPQSLPSPESPSSLDVNLPSASGIEHRQTCEGQTTTDTVHCQTQLLENNIELSTQSVYQSERHSPSGGLSGQALFQSGTHSPEYLPIEIPLGGTGVHISDARPILSASGITNHPVQAGNPMRVPPPLCHDPLQNELERMQRETDHIINIHGNQKLQLKSDCEKEIAEVIAEIRRKYDAKLQEVETEFLSKKKDLESNHKNILVSRILAEAFRSKCTDIRTSSSRTFQQDLAPSFVQQLLQLSSHAPPQRPAAIFSNAGSLASLQASAPSGLQATVPALPAANLLSSSPQGVDHFSARPCPGLSSAGHATSLQTTAPALPVARPHCLAPLAVHRPSAQSLPAVLSSAGPTASLQTVAKCPPAANLHGSTPQVVHPSSALLLRNSMRPPNICCISPSAINRQVGSEIRAPAPHLQRFRSSISMSPASLSSISNGMSCQQVPAHHPSTSATVTQLPAQLQPSTQQSILHNDLHCPESAAILPPHSSSSLSAVQLLIEVDNQAIRNAIPNCSLPPQTDKAPNVDSLVPPELVSMSSPAHPNEIVWLSDDDCCADLLY